MKAKKAAIARRMMIAASMAISLIGCGDYGYRYKATHQSALTPVFADYRQSGDRLDILIDTHGRRLLTAFIRTHEGIEVKPASIDLPEFKGELIGGDGPGWEEPRYGVDRAQGSTILHFKKVDVGGSPWRVEMDLLGWGPVEVIVGEKTGNGG